MIGERLRHDVSVHNIYVSAAQAEQWAGSLVACVRRGVGRGSLLISAPFRRRVAAG